MFRCKECQTEYEVKPDYCDCGNDTFDEIIEKQEKEQTIEKIEQPEVERIEIKKIVENEEIKQEKQVFEEQKTEKIIQKQEEIKQIAPKIQQEKPKNIDNYALLIFLICVILSFVIIFYPIKQTTEQNEIQQKTEQTQENTIPDIDRFWNGEIAKNNLQNKEETAQKEQEIDSQKIEQITKTGSQTVQKKEQKQKEVKQTPQKTTNQNKTQAPKKVQNQTKSTQTVNKNVQTQTKTSTANPQEIARYKVRLRNYIASKIDFTKVVGDGSCSFSFRVTSNGVLIDKKAGYISDNDSLNEVVYNALRQTSSFNAPPTGFNSNSTLKLYVKMQGGAFEVSLN